MGKAQPILVYGAYYICRVERNPAISWFPNKSMLSSAIQHLKVTRIFAL